MPTHPLDWLILLLIVVSAVELVLELRNKRWWAAVVSALFLALLLWIGKGILVSIWNALTP